MGSFFGVARGSEFLSWRVVRFGLEGVGGVVVGWDILSSDTLSFFCVGIRKSS